jgi:probable HAF family extracellular repeat protein
MTPITRAAAAAIVFSLFTGPAWSGAKYQIEQALNMGQFNPDVPPLLHARAVTPGGRLLLNVSDDFSTYDMSCLDKDCIPVDLGLDQVNGLSDGPGVAGAIFNFETGAVVAYANWPIGNYRGQCSECGANDYSYARALNDQGEATGAATYPALGGLHAFKFSSKKGLVDLGTLGGSESYGVDINHRGSVIGRSDMPGNISTHSFIHRRGTMTDLGTLGGANTLATAINNKDQVVGCTDQASGLPRVAFKWSEGTMVSLQAPGTGAGCAYDINDAGEAVGWVNGQPTHFSKGNRARTLASLLKSADLSRWVIYDVFGIDADGRLYGNGRFENIDQPFVMTPPAP